MVTAFPPLAPAGAALLWRIALLVAVVAGLSYVGMVAPKEAGKVAPIWLANAPVLACLLRAPPRNWWIWVAAGLAGSLAGEIAAGGRLEPSVALSLCSSLEVVLCATVAGKLIGGQMDVTRAWHLAAMALSACLSAVISATLASSYLGLMGEGRFLDHLMLWSVSNALGLTLLTPCLLVLVEWRGWLAERPMSRAGAASLTGLAGLAVAVFGQDSWPLTFLIPPAILVACLTLEMFGAAVAVMLTCSIAVGFTLKDHGPLAMTSGGWTARLMVLQLFLLVDALLAFQVAALLRNRRLMREELEAARQEAEARAADAEEAKSQYRLLAERVTDVMSRSTVTGQITYLSPSVVKLSGFSPEDLVGQQMLEGVHPEDQAAFLHAHMDMLRGRRAPGTPIRYRVACKTGGWVWIEGNPSLVRDERGRPVEFVDVSRNVTERVELEARLAAAVAEAERAATVKSDFLANMSHEIRTPLTSILGFASFLDELKLPEPAGGYAAKVTTASRTLLAIVNDVLDFSKLEAGRLEMKPRPTDPAECARDVLDLFGPQAQAKGLELVLEPAAPAVAMIDADRLRQVLMNLVGNAVKFTQSGSVRLSCAYDPAERRLTCKVADTGPGIGAAAMEKLFQRFSQVDGSTTRAHGGTGLGLAISKGLVEAMGGRIGVESASGRGSTFWFEAPAEPAAAAPAEADEAPDVQVMAGVRVLAADDNPQNLEIVRSILTPLGVDLTEAQSGAEAVEAARLAPFDVILMDLRMPGVDGWAAANAIREGHGPNRDAPILAFSADVAPDRREAMGVFQDLVSKPIEPPALLRAILRWTLAEPAAADGEESSGRAAG